LLTTKSLAIVRSLAVLIMLIAASNIAYADRLVAGARIVYVGNTRSASDPSFVVRTEGGTGPCANSSWIFFYPSGASNADIQKRAYTAAMLALTTGMLVDIEAVDASCGGAYFISVYQ
jgi:hypothetical protein